MFWHDSTRHKASALLKHLRLPEPQSASDARRYVGTRGQLEVPLYQALSKQFIFLYVHNVRHHVLFRSIRARLEVLAGRRPLIGSCISDPMPGASLASESLVRWRITRMHMVYGDVLYQRPLDPNGIRVWCGRSSIRVAADGCIHSTQK